MCDHHIFLSIALDLSDSGLLWITGIENTGIGKIQEFDRIAGAKQRITKQRKTAGIFVWMKHKKNTGNMPRSYANECKKEVRVGVETRMELGCRNAIHRNFGGVIPLIQRDYIGKKSYGLESSNIPMKILQSKEALSSGNTFQEKSADNSAYVF